MHAVISAIEYYLPSMKLTTEDLSLQFPNWSVEKIDAKTGIKERHIASENECTSDLAVDAITKLFANGSCHRDDVDFLICCTQTPDYAMPTTACIIQERLNLRCSVGALDVNLGCSGFVYCLGLADGLITSDQAKNIILVTADTYTKYLDPKDKACRTIFGDGAAATFIKPGREEQRSIGPFVYGTDGGGAKDLFLPNSGTRGLSSAQNQHDSDRTIQEKFLFMDGSKVFSFAVASVPECAIRLLSEARMRMNEIDLFIFHQANAYLLEELRARMEIPVEKLQIAIGECANTVSSSIPIAIKSALIEQKIKDGSTIMLIGFGIGYSWAGTIVRWAG